MIDYSSKLSSEQDTTVWQIPKFEHFRQLAANWPQLSQKINFVAERFQIALLGIKQCGSTLDSEKLSLGKSDGRLSSYRRFKVLRAKKSFSLKF